MSETILQDLTQTYRIYYEESAQDVPRAERGMYQELRGAGDTRLYYWGEKNGQQLIAVSTESPIRFNRLRALEGVIPYSGCVVLFPASRLDEIAEIIHAKKKRIVTDEMRERLRTQGREALHRFHSQRSKTDEVPEI